MSLLEAGFELGAFGLLLQEHENIALLAFPLHHINERIRPDPLS